MAWTYYAFWLLIPTAFALMSAHPEILLVIGVAFVARRWLPDPVQYFRLAGRVRSLQQQIEALAKPLAEKERDQEMILALDGLAADYAMPLRLRFLDEMPLERIAAFMGVPLSTVKWRIHHGKKLLRARVEETN